MSQISASEPGIVALDESIRGGIPMWDNRAFTYIGATNNVDNVVYKLGVKVVATVTYTYVGGGAADNDKVVTEALVVA